MFWKNAASSPSFLRLQFFAKFQGLSLGFLWQNFRIGGIKRFFHKWKDHFICSLQKLLFTIYSTSRVIPAFARDFWFSIKQIPRNKKEENFLQAPVQFELHKKTFFRFKLLLEETFGELTETHNIVNLSVKKSEYIQETFKSFGWLQYITQFPNQVRGSVGFM